MWTRNSRTCIIRATCPVFAPLTPVNDSASMAGDKWEQVMNVIIGVAELAAKYDEDGVDVYFLNSKRAGKELKVG